MPRRLGFLLVVLVALASAGPGHAATGINVYGLSWHPSTEGMQGFNPGVGVREQFLRRPGWKADAVVGGYSDSAGDLMLHAALGAQFHVVGDLHLGAFLMAAAQGHALDKIYLAPLPSASFEAGPVDLNVHYIPRVKGVTDESSAFGFHVTFWPFGGRRPITAGPPDPEGRFALEFGVASGPRLTELDGRTVCARWTTSPRHAWRAGFDLNASHEAYEVTESYGEAQSSWSGTADSAELGLLLQHLWLVPSSRGTRLLVGCGADLHYRTSYSTESWTPGLMVSLGAEADLARGLSLLGEYTTTASWQIGDAYSEVHRTRIDVMAGARLGVALWW